MYRNHNLKKVIRLIKNIFETGLLIQKCNNIRDSGIFFLLHWLHGNQLMAWKSNTWMICRCWHASQFLMKKGKNNYLLFLDTFPWPLQNGSWLRCYLLTTWLKKFKLSSTKTQQSAYFWLSDLESKVDSDKQRHHDGKKLSMKELNKQPVCFFRVWQMMLWVHKTYNNISSFKELDGKPSKRFVC